MNNDSRQTELYRTLSAILERKKDNYRLDVDKSQVFEWLVKYYFENNPLLNNDIEKVYLWNQWQIKNNNPRRDTGIDIVIESKNESSSEGGGAELWAVQAKYYHPGSHINKSDIDSTISKAGTDNYKRLYVVTTTEKISTNATDIFKMQRNMSTHIITLEDLLNGPVNYESFIENKKNMKIKRKNLRPHQINAVESVVEGMHRKKVGKLIMACGTGKTLTSLKIAEKIVGKGGVVLYLVPSLSLIKQSIMEWSEQCELSMTSYLVCSDSTTGRDEEDINLQELALPATTNPQTLSATIMYNRLKYKDDLHVIFSTYQSLDIISFAQNQHDMPKIDLTLCDEAHRTVGKRKQTDLHITGFVQIHDRKFIHSEKRLFMTATPVIYNDSNKKKANEDNITLWSMDDKTLFGDELYRLEFSDAVEQGLLSDYKVVFLTIEEKHLADYIQESLKTTKKFTISDVGRLIGCWNGLAKRDVLNENQYVDDPLPMKKAVLFTSRIIHSKAIEELFTKIVNGYKKKLNNNFNSKTHNELVCDVKHIDGGMNSHKKANVLNWLKKNDKSDNCKIVTNAKCLTEGVDVPALDAIIFYHPRRSQVDVVQAVGRVMRKSNNKKFGYVILPVVLRKGVNPDDALKNSDFDVVWEVLQALRAHDNKFEAEINRLDLNNNKSKKFIFHQIVHPQDEQRLKNEEVSPQQLYLDLGIEDWRNAIFGKVIEKCGTKTYWSTWAKDVSNVASTFISRITKLVSSNNSRQRAYFIQFYKDLKKTVNPSVTQEEAIEMLSQHMITKRIFDTLFTDTSFSQHNPVSKSLEKVCESLGAYNLTAESKSLDKFYASVESRVQGIVDQRGKQSIITELYDSFFKTAFKRDAEKLGIVYTPIELVDFILKSVNDLLESEFDGSSMTKKNVKILDPFTGTGTFISQIIQGGYIDEFDIERKYKHELFANEIVLLAYYIASTNIEMAYNSINNKEYETFNGITLSDTFQQVQNNNKSAIPSFIENNERLDRQMNQSIQVIIGNPPYSAGQRNQNDNNMNTSYPKLDKRIRETYAFLSDVTNKNSLYDSYMRAFRWATDRLDGKGIIAFVSNGSFIDSKSAVGFRKSLVNEFDKIYCLNLRGNARTSGETWKKEGGKIFASGSRIPISIVFLVKKTGSSANNIINYCAVDNYLTRDDKLNYLKQNSLKTIKWNNIIQDARGDWINQVNKRFLNHVPISSNRKNTNENGSSVFLLHSCGIKTNKDPWLYNFSKENLEKSICKTIQNYNKCTRIVQANTLKYNKINLKPPINDKTLISWDADLLSSMWKGKKLDLFDSCKINVAMYRPFNKRYVYYDKMLINRTYKMRKIFPTGTEKNKVIVLQGSSATNDFSALMVDCISDMSLIASSICFPLYYYDDASLDMEQNNGDNRKFNINSKTVEEFNKRYNTKEIGEKEIFYFIYGLLHSKQYKDKFSSELKKMTPRLPWLNTFDNFEMFYKAGLELSRLHLKYDSVQASTKRVRSIDMFQTNDYEIDFAKYGVRNGVVDKTVIKFNNDKAIANIPLECYNYIVNGKSAVDWVIERYQSRTDKDSLISENPNDYSTNNKYVLNLFLNVIDLSVKTNNIVKQLPNINQFI